MKAIGFNNFRKFQNFPMMELGGVNVLVGTNNSGKSTAIKAMILLLDNILSWEHHPDFGAPFVNSFRFIAESSSHLYLGGYEKSINSDANGKPMSFSFTTGNTQVSFSLNNDIKNDGVSIMDSMQVQLQHVELKNFTTNVVFNFTFTSNDNGEVKVYLPTDDLKTFVKDERKGEIGDNTNKYKHNTIDENNPIAILRGIARSGWKSYFEEPEFGAEVYWSYQTELSKILNISEDVLEIDSTFFFHSVDYNHSFNDKTSLTKECEKYGFLCLNYIRDSFKQIVNDINGLPKFIYVEAHNATHKNFINIEDKDDFLSQTLSKYLGEGVNNNMEAINFINKWLKELNIADGFSIKNPFEGIYMIDLLNKNKEAKPLGAYGTGSIQFFILLLQIAIAIHSGKNILLFVEEPEQNLHPSLQSRLADLFYEVWKMTNGKVRFVVETHSEYLVRKMQVIVANVMLSEDQSIDNVNHDIKVYYFPDKKEPYPMVFKNNGRFQNKFGQGFFDESSRANYELVLLENRD